MIMLDFAFLVFFVKNLKVVLIFQPVPYKINLYQEEWETAALVKQVQVILPQWPLDWKPWKHKTCAIVVFFPDLAKMIKQTPLRWPRYEVSVAWPHNWKKRQPFALFCHGNYGDQGGGSMDNVTNKKAVQIEAFLCALCMFTMHLCAVHLFRFPPTCSRGDLDTRLYCRCECGCSCF